jgi:hypothetical protein
VVSHVRQIGFQQWFGFISSTETSTKTSFDESFEPEYQLGLYSLHYVFIIIYLYPRKRIFMSPVVDIVEIHDDDDPTSATSVEEEEQDDNDDTSSWPLPDAGVIEEHLDRVFGLVDHSPEMFIRCCLEFIEGKSDILHQHGCEENLVRLMQAVRLHEESQRDDMSDDVNHGDGSLVGTLTADVTEERCPGGVVEDGTSCSDDGYLDPNEGRGASTGLYSWTQSLSEVVVSVPLGRKVKGKDCCVRIGKDRLHVSVGNDEYISGDLFAPVKVDDCMWNLIDSDTVEVLLTKVDGMGWWRSLVKGEREIDTSKIEPEASRLSDLTDPEMRATVEKMMFEQQQKEMSRVATTKEEKSAALKKFMEAHPELDFSDAAIDMS